MENEKKLYLKEKFLSVTTWEELAECIIEYQQIENQTQSTKQRHLQKKDISYALFDKKTKYKEYLIPKKKEGSFRKIEAPIGQLKIIQQIIKELIELCFVPKPSAHGFVKEKSIVTNAKQHTRSKFVYNIDLENFFPKIHFGRVKGVFKNAPFNFSPQMAQYLANLCTNDSDLPQNAYLPQGAATSPIISNLICHGLDAKLSVLAKKHKMYFTKYADDITFSSNYSIFEGRIFKENLDKIIEGENFKINPAKTRLQTQYQRQIVTGLTVNKKVNVSQEFIKDLKFQIRLFEKYGENAQIWLDENYIKDHRYKQRYDGKVPKIERVIEGKLSFLKMVIGFDSPLYFRLAEKFNNAQLEEETKFEKEFNAFFKKLDKKDEVDKTLLEIKLKIKENESKDYLKKIIDKEQKNFNKKINLLESQKLIRNLNDVKSPFEEESYKDIFKESDNEKKKSSYSPLHLAEFLELFHGDSPFKNLVHRNNIPYEEVVNEALKNLPKLGNGEGVFSLRIPVEIYSVIKKFLLDLYNRKDKSEYNNKEYKVFFDKNPNLFQSFRAYYRFNDEGKGVKISDIIKYEFSKNKATYRDLWYLDIDSDIDKTFSNVLTSTFNVAKAIEKILESCQDFYRIGGIGAVKFSAFEQNNTVVLKIINLHAKNSNSVSDFKPSGDTDILKSRLRGYCDLDIVASFKDGNARYTLLPEKSYPISELKNDTVEGFTYELIFYRPLKFLLIDNGGKKQRIKKVNRIDKKLLKRDTELDLKKDANKLKDYNAVFIHSSNDEYKDGVKEILCSNGTPFISFSGENFYKKISELQYKMSDQDFYDKIENYLKQVKETFKLSWSFWEDAIQPNSTSENDLDDIIDEIDDINVLSESTKDKLCNWIGYKVEFTDFSNPRQLINFCKSKKRK